MMASTSRSTTLLFLAFLLEQHFTSAFVSAPENRRFRPSFMSKNSDRAHYEKSLEDLMDNDWRVFRAKLVAQERAEAMERSMRSATNYGDERLTKQAQMGTLFSNTVSSSIFSKPPTHTSPQGGGVCSGRSIERAPIPDGIVAQDPFVSVDEIPVFMKPKVTLDKHRWAHQIPHIEPGCIVVANEKLAGVFHQTIVLIVEHNEEKGTLGVIINRPLNGNLAQVSSQIDSNLNLSLKKTFTNAPVAYGGPVLTEEFSILHNFGEVEGSKKLANGVFIGGSDELMDAVRSNHFDPSHALFVQGHAAWVPGQLSKEILNGVWYCAAASSDLIMRYAGAPVTSMDNPTDLWADILTCMGGYYAHIAKVHGGGGTRLRP